MRGSIRSDGGRIYAQAMRGVKHWYGVVDLLFMRQSTIFFSWVDAKRTPQSFWRKSWAQKLSPIAQRNLHSVQAIKRTNAGIAGYVSFLARMLWSAVKKKIVIGWWILGIAVFANTRQRCSTLIQGGLSRLQICTLLSVSLVLFTFQFGKENKMQYFTYVALVLVLAMTILMGGIVMTRMPKEDLRSAFAEGVFWNMGLFLCICFEILLLENL